MTSTTMDMQVKTYIAAVAARLSDLPVEERDDLMADLEQHLHEVAAEGEASLVERLGTPEAYAAELRTSAGLSPSVSGAPRRSWADVWGRVRETPVVREASQYLPELRAGWWVGRAAIVAASIAMIVAEDSGRDTKLVFGAMAFVLLLVPSILLGRGARRSTTARWMSIAGSVPIVVLGVALLSTVHVGDPPVYYEQYAPPDYLHHPDGTPITNVCAYESDLSPVDGILLFDQDGRPIANVATGPEDPRFNYELGEDPSAPRSGFANVYPRERQLFDPETGTTSEFKCPTIAKETKKRSKGD